MGKFITFMIILIFADLLFILTGQIDFISVGSILVNAIANIGSLSLTQIFSQAIGQFGDLISSGSGLASLGLIAGGLFVSLGLITGKSDTILFIPMAVGFSLLASDFILIANYLGSLNSTLNVIIMAPLSIVFILAMVEWARGKD